MLRRELTISEARLREGIRGGATGARFRRQVPVGIWIADFATFNPKLVIEVDDPSHDWDDETERTGYIEALGFSILRFTNRDVATEIDDVISTIDYWVETMRNSGEPPAA